MTAHCRIWPVCFKRPKLLSSFTLQIAALYRSTGHIHFMFIRACMCVGGEGGSISAKYKVILKIISKFWHFLPTRLVASCIHLLPLEFVVYFSLDILHLQSVRAVCVISICMSWPLLARKRNFYAKNGVKLSQDLGTFAKNNIKMPKTLNCWPMRPCIYSNLDRSRIISKARTHRTADDSFGKHNDK